MPAAAFSATVRPPLGDSAPPGRKTPAPGLVQFETSFTSRMLIVTVAVSVRLVLSVTTTLSV